MMQHNLPNQSASRVSYETKEHQETNENIKQQQAKISQPSISTQMIRVLHRNTDKK